MEFPKPSPSSTIPVGTAFPGTAAVGQRIYRTDRNLEYFWDGTRWLTTQQLVLALLAQETVIPASAAQSQWAANPHFGLYDIWVERFSFAAYSGAALPANFFNAQLVKQGTAGGVNVGAALTHSADTINQLTGHANTPNAIIESTYGSIKTSYTIGGGAPSAYIMTAIAYRLIG